MHALMSVINGIRFSEYNNNELENCLQRRRRPYHPSQQGGPGGAGTWGYLSGEGGKPWVEYVGFGFGFGVGFRLGLVGPPGTGQKCKRSGRICTAPVAPYVASCCIASCELQGAVFGFCWELNGRVGDFHKTFPNFPHLYLWRELEFPDGNVLAKMKRTP